MVREARVAGDASVEHRLDVVGVNEINQVRHLAVGYEHQVVSNEVEGICSLGFSELGQPSGEALQELDPRAEVGILVVLEGRQCFELRTLSTNAAAWPPHQGGEKLFGKIRPYGYANPCTASPSLMGRAPARYLASRSPTSRPSPRNQHRLGSAEQRSTVRLHGRAANSSKSFPP